MVSRKSQLGSISAKRSIYNFGPAVVILVVGGLIFGLWLLVYRTVQVERALFASLPGASRLSGNSFGTLIPDEIVIGISASGQISLEGEAVDEAGMGALPTLLRELQRLKEDANSRGVSLQVTLAADEQTKYDRILQVMEAIAVARILDVTFTVGSEEI